MVNTAFDADQNKPWELAKEGKADEAAAVVQLVPGNAFKPADSLPEARAARAGRPGRRLFAMRAAGLGQRCHAAGCGPSTVGKYEHLMQRVDVKQLDALFEAAGRTSCRSY